MTNKLTVPFLLSCIVLLLVTIPRGQSAAQEKDRLWVDYVRKAQKWEHKVFLVDPEDYTDKLDYKAILQRHGRRKAEAAFLEHVLSHLGQERWELVSYERRNRNVIYLYLKRPVSP